MEYPSDITRPNRPNSDAAVSDAAALEYLGGELLRGARGHHEEPARRAGAEVLMLTARPSDANTDLDPRTKSLGSELL